MEHLYHILSSNDWSEESTVDYLPQSFDEEGFIHLSTEQQLLDTANRHFSQERSLRVLEVNPSGLEKNLIFEQIDEAIEAYPHLYQSLPKKNIVQCFELENSPQGFVDTRN
ncbi:MAG: DUF952 domain-containing protein [SAR324 cluster bacterium]|nr:DUF952 domain-containing protein [SAR324 cluster bacterium]